MSRDRGGAGAGKWAVSRMGAKGVMAASGVEGGSSCEEVTESKDE